MVSNVAAGGVTYNENPVKVNPIFQPSVRTFSQSLAGDPLHCANRVVHGRREAVLGSEPIVRRHHERLEARAEAEAAAVAVGPGAGADAEATAVEEEDNGEVDGGGGGSRPVEAEAEAVGVVEKGVFPVDGSVVVNWKRELYVLVLGPEN